MALFGNSRDVSLFRHINRELIRHYIDTEVLVYKLNLSSTQTNIYEETVSKVYSEGQLIHSIVSVEESQWNSDDYGIDVTQLSTFTFLRDDLVEKNLPIEIGDVIEYRSRFFEIDSINENQLVVGKDPDNWFQGDSHGYNVSIVCQAHMTRQSKLNIVQTRFGNSVTIKNNTLPKNL
jgi:hypothetical protein